MNPAAHVTSIDAMSEFQAALLTFADRARDVLASADTELRRLLDWLNERARHYEAEIRAAENAVFEAKAELTRKKMMRIGDRRPDTIDQEKALARAEAWLEQSQEMWRGVRRWQREFPEHVSDYDGPARQLKFLLEAHAPRMAAFLTSKIEALDNYRQPG